jgi:hypothetical protein
MGFRKTAAAEGIKVEEGQGPITKTAAADRTWDAEDERCLAEESAGASGEDSE